MGKIMELFYGELGAFQAKMEDDKWEVEFRMKNTRRGSRWISLYRRFLR